MQKHSARCATFMPPMMPPNLHLLDGEIGQITRFSAGRLGGGEARVGKHGGAACGSSNELAA